MKEVAKRSFDGGVLYLKKIIFKKSLPQSAKLTAPSSEGANYALLKNTDIYGIIYSAHN